MLKRSVTFFSFWILILAVTALPLAGQSSFNISVQDRLYQNGLDQNAQLEYNHFAASDEIFYSQKLESLGIHVGLLHTSTSNVSREVSPVDLRSLNHCKSLVYRTLKSLPAIASQNLKNLTLHFSDNGRRGYGGGNEIVMRCFAKSAVSRVVKVTAKKDLVVEKFTPSDEEFVGVLVHELGHTLDTGYFTGSSLSGASEFRDGKNPVYNNDPSLDFYRLSFKDENTVRDNVSGKDFPSGYATTDAFEDFAETFAYYVLHGNEFRLLKNTSAILKKKYEFLKSRVFGGKEFFNGSNINNLNLFERNFDVTVLRYDLKKLFVI